MEYLLLLVVILLSAAQNTVQKQYNKKTKTPNTFLFAACSAFCAFIFYIVSIGTSFRFDMGFLGYSAAFALCFCASVIGHFLAIKWGSMSLTMLIQSYSLLIPTTYGIVFLNEKLSPTGISGIILLMISIFMVVNRKDKAVFSIKWFISMFMAFLGGGMCSTVQKMQQLAFGGDYKQEFMAVAMLISIVILLTASAFKKENGGKTAFFASIGFGAMNGVANGIVNLTVMVLTGMVANSILFPSVSAGGIVAGFVIATLIYKEKLKPVQIIGYIIGVLSIILLNI